MPACEHFGVGILPFFPLASGLLTGKYRRGEPPPDDSRIKHWGMTAQLSDERFDVVERLEAFAAERSVSLLDVALGGLAAKPTVASVIAGATSPEQVRANVAATAWQPSARRPRTAVTPARYQVSMQGRFLPARGGTGGAERRPAMIRARVSAGSITSSISKCIAMLSALPRS